MTYDEREALMEAVRGELSIRLAQAVSERGGGALEMVTIALSIVADMVTGGVNGVLLFEQLRLRPAEDCDQMLRDLREVFVSCSQVSQRDLTELVDMSLERHDSDKAKAYLARAVARADEARQMIADIKRREQADTAVNGAARPLTAEEFARMMMAQPPKGQRPS